MLSANVSPDFINISLSSPSIDTSGQIGHIAFLKLNFDVRIFTLNLIINKMECANSSYIVN